ncbi:DUF1801 domain-containing protein [Peteryoungia ipomoeae]|uniref:DUF1801 domain-containing protein n=2 Tax=Peteryoungia ipomoeae TaxID=1210932 RepID=A0A4S8P3X9_9HYPH|nr:DUF1801 domain-containing protein [Peteryoungia ipomoeae]THV24658.1 DUF1801 domain-containing protein [Peteryoungia ipomoeae]
MSGSKTSATSVLLSGGNPQIAKADGDQPVQAYIAAMPDWKQAVGRKLDTIIEREVPGVTKKVRWNSPFYGAGNDTFFVSFHCMTRYIKVTFFNGTDLMPMPKETSKSAGIRYFHIPEPGAFDEEQFADWIRQAGELPGIKI